MLRGQGAESVSGPQRGISMLDYKTHLLLPGVRGSPGVITPTSPAAGID